MAVDKEGAMRPTTAKFAGKDTGYETLPFSN